MKINNIIANSITLFLFFNITCCSYIKNNKTDTIKSNIEHNDLRSAETYYNKFIKNGDYNQLEKAADLYKFTDINKAIELYKILKESKTHELHACESLIFAYLEINKIESAKHLVDYILSIDATRYKPLSALALVLALSDDHESAIKYFDLALTFIKSPIVLNNKALTLAFIGKKEEAINVIDEAANIIGRNHPSKTVIAMNQALIYGLNNMIDEVYNILKPYLSESQIYNNIALYAILTNDTKKAKDYLYKALDSNNHYKKAEHNLDILKQN